MKRDFKFRVWDTKHKKFLERGIVIRLNGRVDEVSCGEIMGEEPGCIIQQYIGVKDRNRKEIYEGDIVKWNDDIGEFVSMYVEKTGTVEWDDSWCHYIVVYTGEDGRSNEIPMGTDSLTLYEVIGNIFETPENRPTTSSDLIFNNHYSKIMPRLTKYYLGAYVDEKLVGVITLGWGTRPLHTIKKLFPSLITKDYFEIGKMCMLEEMPKNSESQLLSATISWIKNNEPSVKILFTWADGILGKPGYVYQAANFLFGGYIWTDLYITDKGEKIHPRTSQGLTDKGDKICGHRPTKEYMIQNGWNHYKGKQFRYLQFLCNKIEKKKLLAESTEKWSIDYPKKGDIKWQKQDLITGEWKEVPEMFYDQSITTIANKKVVENKIKVGVLETARQFFEL